MVGQLPVVALLKIEEVDEGGNHRLEVDLRDSIGGQRCLQRTFGLGNQPLPIDPEHTRRSFDRYKLLLCRGQGVEFLRTSPRLRRGQVESGLLNCWSLFAPKIKRYPGANREHVIVAKTGAGLFVRVTEREIGNVALARENESFLAAFLHSLSDHQIGRVFLNCSSKPSFTKTDLGGFNLSDHDVGRVEVAPQLCLKLGLKLSHRTMVMLDLIEHLSRLKLRFEDVLRLGQAESVTRLRNPFGLQQLTAGALKQAQCLGQVRELEVSFTDLFRGKALRRLVLMVADLGVLLRDLSLEPQFPRPGNILRHAKTCVVEIAGFIASRRLWTPDRELLQLNLGIRQRAHLRRDVSQRLPMVPGSDNAWVAFHCLAHQRIQLG